MRNRYYLVGLAIVGVIILFILVASFYLYSPFGQRQYDENSWKSIIPATCIRFYDGCNDCIRPEGYDPKKDDSKGLCTLSGFCGKYGGSVGEYEKPRCLDNT
jgi:hypothetical protein